MSKPANSLDFANRADFLNNVFYERSENRRSFGEANASFFFWSVIYERDWKIMEFFQMKCPQVFLDDDCYERLLK